MSYRRSVRSMARTSHIHGTVRRASRNDWIHVGWSVWNGSQKIGYLSGADGYTSAFARIPEAWFGDDKTRLKNLHIEKVFTEV